MKLSSGLILVTAITCAACAAKKQPQPSAAATTTPPANVEVANQGPQLSNEEVANQLLAAVNKQRTDNGLRPLQISPELNNSAQEHSTKMLAESFLSTRGADEPSVITRITAHDVKTLKLGEDVVRIKTRSDHLADETVSIWMGAAADRKNILSPAFTKTGIGVTRAADGDYYITEDFVQ